MKKKSFISESIEKCRSILTGAFACVAFLACTPLNAQTYNPFSYYTFDNSSSPLKDEMGNGNLDPNYYSSPYTINTNASATGVSKYLTIGSAATIIKGSSFSPDTGLTVEFLFCPGLQMETENIMWSQNGSFGIYVGYPYLQFNTTAKTISGGVSVSDVFKVDLSDIGRKSFGYYIDGKWHHMVFKMNPKTGVKQIWVDGECPTGFSKTVSTANCHFVAGTYNAVYINSTTAYMKYRGDLDEIAVYKYDLNPNMIYKHYQNFVSNSHYSFTWTATAPPPAASVTGSLDMNEFPPGFNNPTVNAVDQIKAFPAARMRPGSSLLRNGTFVNFQYLGGRDWPGISNAQSVANSVEIQKQLMNNFNYSIEVSCATTEYQYFGDTTHWTGAWVKLANQNPSISTTINTAWTHVVPKDAGYKSTETYATCNCLPNSSYLQNTAGQFISLTGSSTSDKILAPDAPVDSIKQDGLTQKFYFQKLFQHLNRPLDFIIDESENIPMYRTAYNGPTLDVSVAAQQLVSGLDWYTYYGRKYANFTNTYRDNFMNLSNLSNTSYQMYEIEGHDDYREKYSETRIINTLKSGNHYPVQSFYTRYPWNWRYNYSAWNGWQWFIESRINEIAAGDKYCSPAIAAGWDATEENNIRPAQWLGLTKSLAMAGAEYFYPAVFVLGTTALQNPANYAWQVAIPGYVQGITSRYEDLFKNGYLMQGDLPVVWSNPTGAMGYSFKSGDVRKLVVVRKHNTLAKYAITGTIQPNSNVAGNAEPEGVAQITLDGQVIKFKVRRQGSSYIYDKTNASSPVFYQLDGWHEASHPYNWTKDFYFEGELFDNNNSGLTIKTQIPSGTPSGDFTNFTSYVNFNTSVNATYNFTTRGSSTLTYYFWLRARAKTAGGTLTVQLDNGTSVTVNNIGTSWDWYRFNASTGLPIVYSKLSVGNHFLNITSNSMDVDQIVLTTQSGLIFGGGSPPVTISTAINANGPLTFCKNSQVSLTCGTGVSYLWNNGSTTQTITVNSSGNYFATITGTSSVVHSDTAIVTAKKNPTASYTASGPLKVCSPSYNSVILTADKSYTYQWSNGVTSQSATITTPGTYTVTVSNHKGCSAVSDPIKIKNCSLRLDDGTESDQQAALYPNPSNDISYLTFISETETGYTVKVINTAGQQLLTKEGKSAAGENTVTLNTEQLAQGVYTVQLIMNDEVRNLRLQKQ